MTRTATGHGLEKVVLCAVLACTGAGPTACAATASTLSLTQVAQTWPTSWTTTGTHSEATYVEQVTTSRRGDVFDLRIVITAQGSQSGGTWNRSVRVDSSGHIADLDPKACGGSCAHLDGTRGYLAGAALLAAQRSADVPTAGVVRSFGDREVICVDGDQLYRAAGMATDDSLRLDPCFDRASGAVVAQYSPTIGTFGGPTLDTDTLRVTVPTRDTP